jgi:hypothetical protein
LLGAAVGGAAPPVTFAFDPQPRWAEEPETEVVCAAIVKECPGFLKDGEIEASWGYAELYDAKGRLAGVRSVKSTGCRPLDEHMLLGQRKFRTTFSKPGQSDLDGITVELARGTPEDAVRLVKQGETSISMGC